jgi:hypothetical protein
MNPIWWPATKVRDREELPLWQQEGIYRIAAKWEANPLGQVIFNVFVVLPGRLLIFTGCLLVVPLGLILGAVTWCKAPFVMLRRWYWFAYLVHLARKKLRRAGL